MDPKNRKIMRLWMRTGVSPSHFHHGKDGGQHKGQSYRVVKFMVNVKDIPSTVKSHVGRV